jgi:hypothetical protein
LEFENFGRALSRDLWHLDLATISLRNVFMMSSQLLNNLGDFDETWYKERCAYSKESPVQLFLKEQQPLDLTFSPKNTFVFATVPKSFGRF